MRIFITVLAVLVALAGIGYGFIAFFYTYPDEVARAYMESIVQGEYEQLESFHHTKHPFPQAEEIETGFENFAEAYGLTKIELVGLHPVEEKFTTAVYTVDLRYESRYFEPLLIQFQLNLAWDGPLTWKVEWADVLPLPQYGLKAEYRRTRVEPSRGSIYDRDGRLLAGRGSAVSIGVQPSRISDPELLFQVLGEQLGLTREYVESKYQAPGVQPHWFVPLITVSEELYQELDPILRPVPGIFFQRQYMRYYPLAEAAAHLTGYLGEVTQAMIDANPERDYQAGETAGRSGLEMGLEAELRGEPGYRLFVETDTEPSRLFLERTVKNGSDVELTIDAGWQRLAYEVLGGGKGAFVVLDARTGEVLVLASSPSYDPNEFIAGISQNRWQQLSSDPGQPMFNRSLQGAYPPGSVFKVITASAALDLDLYSVTSEFDDSGELRVQGNPIRNFQNEVFGEHSFADALIRSINTTMAQVGLTLGAENLRSYFTKWGLDQKHDFRLPASAGDIGSPERSQVALAWSAIGQDRVLVTPLVVAEIFTAFVNEGAVPEPTLFKRDDPPVMRQVIKPETAALMSELLAEVVVSGTGRQAMVEGLQIFGKTGTAETGRGTSHGWFGGYVFGVAGRDLAFAVLVEDGGVGGQVAAPLVSEFFSKVEW